MSVMNYKEITDLLPHRYPFLLVDRVTELEDKKRIVGYKNVTINEEFFNGHFPGHPIMPGVLILEALAQISGLMGLATMDKERVANTVYYFAGMDKVRFKRPVLPGDQLELEARYVTDKRGIWRFECEARVDGELACKADIMCAERELDFD